VLVVAEWLSSKVGCHRSVIPAGRKVAPQDRVTSCVQFYSKSGLLATRERAPRAADADDRES
jgi:hypothetical protein